MSDAKTSYRQALQPVLMQTAHIYTQQLTTYRSGVCIGNWVEADAAQELAAQATFARFTATTTVQDTYRPEVILHHMVYVSSSSPGTWHHTLMLALAQGRYGNAMLLSAVRQDLERQHACTGREMLFKHGGMGQPPVSCYASLKGLTDGEHALQMTNMVAASGDADHGFRWRTHRLLALLQPKYWSCDSPKWRTSFG